MRSEPTNPGANRTGTGTAPISAPRAVAGAEEGGAKPPNGDFAAGHGSIHRQYADGAEPLGKMPPPATLKGMAKTVMDLAKGMKSTVLLDKLGERLAFERTGTRLYDGLILKLEVQGSWPGGPTKEELQHIRAEECEHFEMLVQAMSKLGADPTAMTPAADASAVMSLGLEKVVADARTSLSQALHAIHVAELADNDGWTMLVELADAFGQDALASDFRRAEQEEVRHLEQVRAWMRAYAMHEAGASS